MDRPYVLAGKSILLIVTGGIAAYKTPELVRLLKSEGADVRCVLTRAGAEFVTPLTLAAVSGNAVHQDLFSLTIESEMGHIQLSRLADVTVIAPATANTLAKLAHGLADDLASTVLLATDTDVLAAPAMNVRMWHHFATQDNVALLKKRGVQFIGPDEGNMACGEFGEGRMSEPATIVETLRAYFNTSTRLSGRRVLVTSGPTHEPIDPVRYIANRSSGKQGHAIATALARLGAETTLITGPTQESDPAGVNTIHVETARQMMSAVDAALEGIDVAVCAAAVADWRMETEASDKIKKDASGTPQLTLIENPDILASISTAENRRPYLVVGFAAETTNLIASAQAKLTRKGCDWIVANDVSGNTFGGADNTVHIVSADGVEEWPRLSKADVAERLAARIADHLEAAS